MPHPLVSFLTKIRLPLRIAAACVLFGFFAQFTATRLWNSGGIVADHLTGDSAIFFAAARALRDGATPYVPSNAPQHPGSLYCYPPLLAVLLSPFAHLPLWSQNLLWYSILTFSFCGIFYLLLLIARQAGIAPPSGWAFIALTAAAVLLFEPIQNNFLYAQANAPILFLTLLTMYLLLRRAPALAATCAAFGAAIKLFPLIFLPYLFWRKRWAALATGAAALVLFSLLSFLYASDGYYHDYAKTLHARAASNYNLTEFFATAYRSLIWFFPAATSKAVEFVCAAALMGGVMLLDLRYASRPAGGARTMVWTLAILCNCILMIHPHTESHVMIFCIPAFVLGGLWVLARGTLAQRILYAASYLLYVPLLEVQDTPLTFLSLLTNSLLCALILRQTAAEAAQQETRSAAMEQTA